MIESCKIFAEFRRVRSRVRVWSGRTTSTHRTASGDVRTDRQVEGRVLKDPRAPARIRILQLLPEGEHSVGELMPKFGLESSHLSRQLAVLRRSGMVVARTQGGNNVIYSIASEEMAEPLLLARKVLTRLLTDQVGLLKDLQASSPATARAGR